MQDVNRLKLVLVEQKKGGVHDVDNIVEGTQQVVVRRTEGETFHRFQMVYEPIAVRY